jgi:hypothetical protein
MSSLIFTEVSVHPETPGRGNVVRRTSQADISIKVLSCMNNYTLVGLPAALLAAYHM